jgi:hypothetical protein
MAVAWEDSMTELPQVVINCGVVLLAFLTAALVWLMGELRQLRRELTILREQRDFWIDYAHPRGDDG